MHARTQRLDLLLPPGRTDLSEIVIYSSGLIQIMKKGSVLVTHDWNSEIHYSGASRPLPQLPSH